MSEKNEAERLKEEQRQREATEEHLARSAPDAEEAAAHDRRAEKAAYLRSKLEERTEAEREGSD